MRYTLAGAARPWLGGIIGSESMSGGETGDARAAHGPDGQHDEDEDVDGIYVARGTWANARAHGPPKE